MQGERFSDKTFVGLEGSTLKNRARECPKREG